MQNCECQVGHIYFCSLLYNRGNFKAVSRYIRVFMLLLFINVKVLFLRGFWVSSAHQCCIYWIKNIIAILNNCFRCESLLHCNLFLWSKLNFQHYYCSLQCHIIFRNLSISISDYNQYWKQLCCPICCRKYCLNKYYKIWIIIF